MQGSAVEPIELNLPGGGTAILLKPGKDSKWLTLEVCRDFARGCCPRTTEDCKYAHPPAHVESQNGRVVCCFDSIKSKCQRTTPPCKYLHPPAHLKDQLLETGRQNLVMKNLQLHSVLSSLVSIPPTQYPMVYNSPKTAVPNGYGPLILTQQPQYMTSPGQYIMQTNGLSTGATPYQLYANSYPPLASNTLQNCVQFVPLNAGFPMTNVQMPQTGGVQFQMRPLLTQYVTDPFQEVGGHNQVSELWGYPLQQNLDSTEKLLSLHAGYKQALDNSNLNASLNNEESTHEQISRKRSLEVARESNLLGQEYLNLLPPIKRAALIDPKSNLPIYQPLLNNMQHFAFAQMPTNQQMPISLTHNGTLLQKY